MARINVDDDVESKLEYKRLLKLLGGDDFRALGMLVSFWRLAQDYWGQGLPVPLEEMKEWGFEPIIESRFAIVKEDGVYAKDGEERFGWYKQRVDAGKKRGEAPRNELGRFVKETPEPEPTQGDIDPAESSGTPAELDFDPAEHQRDPARHQRNELSHQPLSLSLSLAPVLSQKLSKQKQEIQADQAQQRPPPDLPVPKKSKFSDLTRRKMQSFLANYAKGWKEKYPGAGPPEGINSKALLGKIGHWIEHVSEERAVSLVQVYLQINYRPFEESLHDLWQFFRHLNRIGHALDTGQDSDQVDWSRVFAKEGA